MSSYLSQLKNFQKPGPQVPTKPTKPPIPQTVSSFVGFVGTPPPPFQKNSPGAQGIEKSENRARQARACRALPSTHRTIVNIWVDRIGETDLQARAEYLATCARDPRALDWTMRQLAALAPADSRQGHRPAPPAPKAPRQPARRDSLARAAHDAYLNHLIAAARTGCGCYATGPQPRFCPEGERRLTAYRTACAKQAIASPPPHQRKPARGPHP
jgi:hypothetical protein